jgi:CBS domain-containing protein
MDKIYNYMTEQLKTIEHDASVFEAAVKFRDLNIRSLVVTQNQEYVGIITDVDISRKVVAEGINPKEIAVSSIMQPPTIRLDKKLPMTVALQTMKKNNVRHVLVTDQSKIVGILSIQDFASFYCNMLNDPILQFWSNYECLLDKAPFDYAIEKLLKGMVEHIGEESKTGQAIKNNKSIAEIAQIAEEEGLDDLKQILRLSVD